MIHVLFVCLGNICRSPMAEAVFRHKVRELGLADQIIVDSAGTGGWHTGEPPHRGTRKELDVHKVNYQGIAARQVSVGDFSVFRYVVAMDASNQSHLQLLANDSFTGEMKRLMDYVPNTSRKDVPDPYYTGNFEEVYGMIDEGCDCLLAYIRSKEGI